MTGSLYLPSVGLNRLSIPFKATLWIDLTKDIVSHRSVLLQWGKLMRLNVVQSLEYAVFFFSDIWLLTYLQERIHIVYISVLELSDTFYIQKLWNWIFYVVLFYFIVFILDGNSEQVAQALCCSNTLNRSNNTDCFLRVHLFLNCHISF